MKTVIRCGICDMNFDDEDERSKHFGSEAHRKKLRDPDAMAEAYIKSQRDLIRGPSLDDLKKIHEEKE